MLSRDLKKNWLAFGLTLLLALSLASLPLTPAEANHGDRCLDVEPESDTNPTGTTHTVSATLRDPSTADPGTLPGAQCTGDEDPAPTTQASGPVLIYFEITGPNDPDGTNSPESPDRQCVIEIGESSCDMPPYPTGGAQNTGTDTIRGWISDEGLDADEPANEGVAAESLDEPDGTDVVTKTWVPGAPARLDCDDQSGDDRETNPSSTTLSESNEVYTCRVTDAQGNRTGDADSTNTSTSDTVVVRGENESGANDPDRSTTYSTPDYQCTPSRSTGECTVTVSQVRQEEGTALICFWIDNDPAQNDGATLCAGEQVDDPENDDKADKVEKTWLSRASASASTVDAEPENATNELGQTHRITATVFDQFRDEFVGNTTVNFEFFQGSPTDTDGNTPNTPDRTCSTQQTANGQQTNTTSCSIEYTQTLTTGRDLVCVWVGSAPTMTGNNTAGTCNGEERATDDDTANEADAPAESNDNVDVVEKNWVQAPNPTTATRLDCSPEQDTNPTRSSHTITCTATNNQGGRVGGAGVDAEATGANDPDNSDSRTSPDFSCTTASQDNTSTPEDERGTCSFTHGSEGRGTTNSAGTTTYRAWVDVDGSNSTAEADPTEGRDETGQPGETQEPDGTDVVEKTWVSDPATLTMTPESDSAPVGVCNPFTITVRDVDEKPVQGVIIDVEQRHERANDTTVGNEPEVGFCTPPEGSGPNRSDVNESSGDFRPPAEDPDNRGTASGETVLPTDANGQVTIGIEVTEAQGSDGSGTVTLTAFYDREPENDDPDATEPQDTSTKTWTTTATEGGRTIDCAPEEATTPTGDDHVVTCTVTDAAGQPASGIEVTFSESGPGEIVDGNQKMTGQDGRASVTVRSTTTGEQTITGTITNSTQSEPDMDECNRAAGDPTGAPQGVCSDSVTNTWTEDAGKTCPNQESDTRNHIVGTEGNDTIRGTEGDDVICGLGGDDLIDGLGGNDLIIGGSGNDSLRGGDGNDEIKGNSGKDELRGNGGNDVLRGGNQNDDLRGNAGDDVMRGQAGFDVLRGGSGDDEGHGGSGNDTIQGFTGNDLLVGNSGNDTMKGAGGRDEIRGGKNDDVISGGKGPDRIRGGPGRDVCAGGPGNDNIRGCER